MAPSHSVSEEEPLLDGSRADDAAAAASTNADHHQDQEDYSESLAPATTTTKPDSDSSVVVSFFRSTFGFNKAPFSLLFVLTFALVVLVSSTVQSGDIEVSSQYPLKFLSNGWMDLQEISKEFHPYTSHANDRVHDYILSQVSDIVAGSDNAYIRYEDDIRPIFFQAPDVFNPAITGRVNYFEGNNILAKVQGKNPDLPGVLLSAHFDSVPTAYGTTDDGAGIASMLSILRYYADKDTPQPERSIVFNFNNDEEFGLLGAQAFFYHPWSKNVSVFLNLEGTGAGGRAILFRATDYGVAKHYKAASSPHANSLFQQGFSDGLVRSETDYKVYTSNGLRGLDIAFYKPRNLYHTRRDSIRGTTYGALSHMFTNALDVTRSLTGAGKDDFGDDGDDLKFAVYFDILGQYLVVFPLSFFFTLHVFGLVAGPVIVSLLFFAVKRSKSWDIGVRGWFRGIVSLAASIAVTIFAAIWIHDTNELIVVSTFYSPFLALLSVFLLTNYIILGLSSYLRPVPDQKLVLFIESFVLLWALLVVSTVHITKRRASGEYALTVVYYLYFAAVVLGLLGLLVAKSDKSHDQVQPLLLEDDEDNDNDSATVHNVHSHKTAAGKLRHVATKSLSFDWSLQFIVVIPIAFYLVFSTGLLTFEALRHNAMEGASGAKTVYTVLTSVSIAVGFLVLPFIHRFHALVTVLLLISLVSGGLLSLNSFPLTHEAPIKIRFVQTIDLDDAVPKAQVSILTRTGYGYKVLSDLPSVKANSLPITCKPYGKDDNEVCTYEGLRPWLISDKDVDVAADYNEWLNVTALRTHTTLKKRDNDQSVLISDDDDENFGPFGGEVLITAKENRQCTIEFNTTSFKSSDGTASPVRVVTYYHDSPSDTGNLSLQASAAGDANEPDVIKWYKGVNDVTVHKLNWTQPGYHLDFQWIPRWYETGVAPDTDTDASDATEPEADKRALGLHVSCQWGEYDTESIVGHAHRGDDWDRLRRRVPALDEILAYSPPWTTWDNWGPGLVVVKKYVEL